MIVLVGFMGAGKTTVGRLIAERTGLPFVDTDLVVERRQKRAIRDIFRVDGEEAFRDVEEQTVADVLAGPDAVVSLGGGACGRQGTREVLARHTPVHLDVSLEESRDRTRGDAYRPMLHRPDLAELHAERRRVYESVARITVPTDGRRAEAIALDVLDRVTGREGILVAPPGGTYRVHVARGVLARAAELLPAAGQTLVLGTATDLERTGLLATLESAGRRVRAVELPDGPAGRTLSTVERVADVAAEAALHRDDLIVGVGGETVCDVAGFLAATYNRGMRLALVPRSLEAQADSSVGGKASLDLAWGRGLLGVVHQPEVVISDPDGVSPAQDPRFRAGLAEMVKHALVAEPEDLDGLVDQAPAVLAGDPEVLARLVRRSVTTKARVVTEDEREAAGRLHLNYGHTFSHAIEHQTVDEASRVDALALGMMAAAHTAHRLGLLDADGVEVHRRVLTAFGLPVSGQLVAAHLHRSWLRDKKYQGGPRFVLLHAPGRPEAGVPVDEATLNLALIDLAEDR